MIKTTNHKAWTVLAVVVFIAGLAVIAPPASADETTAKEAYNGAIKAAQEGNTDQAIMQYRIAIDQDPSYADPAINLGAIFFEQKDYDNALQMFRMATERDDTRGDAWANLGRVHYILKQYVEAELNLTPDKGSLYIELGKVYDKKKATAEAVTAFEKAHSLGAGDHLSYYMLGNAYSKQSKKTEAIAAFKKSIEIKSNFYFSHSALGKIYLAQEKYQLAAGEYKKAADIDTKKYHAGYNYAIAVQSQDPENYERALQVWQEFIQKYKNNAKAKSQVASARETVKALKEATDQANLQ